MNFWLGKKNKVNAYVKQDIYKTIPKARKRYFRGSRSKTKITQSTKGSGRIVINFSSLGALQGILEKIKD